MLVIIPGSGMDAAVTYLVEMFIIVMKDVQKTIMRDLATESTPTPHERGVGV